MSSERRITPAKLENQINLTVLHPMKFNASAQNAFSLHPTFSPSGQWDQVARRRPNFKIKPFAFEEIRPSLAVQDELARKQEIICTILLGLCLLFTLLHCMTQLSPL